MRVKEAWTSNPISTSIYRAGNVSNWFHNLRDSTSVTVSSAFHPLLTRAISSEARTERDIGCKWPTLDWARNSVDPDVLFPTITVSVESAWNEVARLFEITPRGRSRFYQFFSKVEFLIRRCNCGMRKPESKHSSVRSNRRLPRNCCCQG